MIQLLTESAFQELSIDIDYVVVAILSLKLYQFLKMT